ncbi:MULTISPECIES: DUF2795 domain-containing protein [unclassified Leifsonia]|uniref:DUF2795 domain-containing protein n=1 Tax=unclassified Leifsonia TaxID=2663824 RepID=UPI0006F9A239|nr:MULTISPECIES: DUF2795 domain-containing protein [unclassified Leifsonia]KQX06917.1 hypothetical protein ASC59_03605 [Leifsonia sp. Root1293]KRA11202.1 hypothetical protein ASD61_03605 [Leifsonia sp. Root60]
MDSSSGNTTQPLSTDERESIAGCLRTVDYPAHRDDILRAATSDGLSANAVEALRALPDGTDQSTFYVLRMLDHVEASLT